MLKKVFSFIDWFKLLEDTFSFILRNIKDRSFRYTQAFNILQIPIDFCPDQKISALMGGSLFTQGP